VEGRPAAGRALPARRRGASSTGDRAVSRSGLIRQSCALRHTVESHPSDCLPSHQPRPRHRRRHRWQGKAAPPPTTPMNSALAAREQLASHRGQIPPRRRRRTRRWVCKEVFALFRGFLRGKLSRYVGCVDVDPLVQRGDEVLISRFDCTPPLVGLHVDGASARRAREGPPGRAPPGRPRSPQFGVIATIVLDASSGSSAARN